MSENQNSEYKSTEKTLARMSTPPTTPSTVGCNSPNVLFATPDSSMESSMEHEESGLEESITDSPMPARSVSPDAAFKLLTREAPPEPDFLESNDSETVDQTLAGMTPSRISSKTLVRDLCDLSQPFHGKIAKCEEEMIEADIQQSLYIIQQSLDERCTKKMAFRSIVCLPPTLIKVKEEAPAEEESGKPRIVAFGLPDDVRVFTCSNEVTDNHNMLEAWPIYYSSTDDYTTDVEVSLISTADEKYESFSHSASNASYETVDQAKYPSLADLADRRNDIVDGGEVCADSQTGDIAVDALDESGCKLEVSPYRFINCTYPRADSASEVKEIESVDSDSIVSDFFTESKRDEEEESRGTNSTHSTFAEDVRHMLSDIGANFAKVGSDISLRLNCSTGSFTDCSQCKYNRRNTPLPNLDEMQWLSPSSGDFDRTISILNSFPDYGAPQVSRTFSLDFTAIPTVNSMCTRDSDVSSRKI
jgi:hypothetical protein